MLNIKRLIIALCGLVSIVLFSQQLTVRHWPAHHPQHPEGWMRTQTGLQDRLTNPRFHNDSSDDSLLDEAGLYWSEKVMAGLTSGLEPQTLEDQISELRARKVKRLEDANRSRCGRGQNRFLTFHDGSSGCARYREPHNQLVLGELMSFYLARLLSINTVPAVVLSRLEPDSPVWSGVLQEVESTRGWRNWNYGAPVALIQWVEGLARLKMPEILRRALLAKQTVAVTSASSELTVSQARELADWSDLAVFDFITAHYDRVARMLEAVEKEDRPEVLSEKVPNLMTNTNTGRLWMIDNEAGLLDGYARIDPKTDNGLRFQGMHRDFLHSFCVFKKSTAAAVFALNSSGDAVSQLEQLISRHEPLYQEMIKELPGWQVWREKLQQRIEEVTVWMKECQERKGFSNL